MYCRCRYCGKKIADDFVFCPYCGEPQEEQSISEEDYIDESLPTKVTEEDVADGVEDKYGVSYSKDGERLLECKNKKLTQYTVKAGTKVICDGAFRECENLTAITLPESLQRIDGNPFVSRSAKITSKSPLFKVENGLLIQGNNVINAIGNPTSVIVPDYITTIGERAFCGCECLTSIKLPEELEEIGMIAFGGCKNLTSINLPEGLTTIGDGAFWLCVKLTEIKLPNGLTLIGNLAFNDCESLESIKIPEGLTTIGNMAFGGCKNLTSINLPEGLTTIGKNAFDYCTRLESIRIPKSVTEIGNRVFYGCESLTSIELPEGLTTIGYQSFCECKNLTSIELPEGLTSIRSGAFEGCEKLSSIVLPKSLKKIKGNPFVECDADITSKSPFFEVENGLLIQGTGVIAAIGNPKSIIVPDYITTIGNSAFKRCEKLESIELPERLAYIGIDAFAACKSLTSIELPDSISIELPYEGCFWGRAFEGCKNLKKVYIRCFCYSDGYYAIDKFRKYLSYELHDKIEMKVVDEFGVMYSTDGERLLKSTNCDLSFYTVRKYTKVICDKAFEGCKSLRHIELPEGLEEIGKDAFEKCDNLERIDISCLYKADEAAVIEKFKKLLPKRLHDKIEIVRW